MDGNGDHTASRVDLGTFEGIQIEKDSQEFLAVDNDITAACLYNNSNNNNNNTHVKPKTFKKIVQNVLLKANNHSGCYCLKRANNNSKKNLGMGAKNCIMSTEEQDVSVMNIQVDEQEEQESVPVNKGWLDSTKNRRKIHVNGFVENSDSCPPGTTLWEKCRSRETDPGDVSPSQRKSNNTIKADLSWSRLMKERRDKKCLQREKYSSLQRRRRGRKNLDESFLYPEMCSSSEDLSESDNDNYRDIRLGCYSPLSHNSSCLNGSEDLQNSEGSRAEKKPMLGSPGIPAQEIFVHNDANYANANCYQHLNRLSKNIQSSGPKNRVLDNNVNGPNNLLPNTVISSVLSTSAEIELFQNVSGLGIMAPLAEPEDSGQSLCSSLSSLSLGNKSDENDQGCTGGVSAKWSCCHGNRVENIDICNITDGVSDNKHINSRAQRDKIHEENAWQFSSNQSEINFKDHTEAMCTQCGHMVDQTALSRFKSEHHHNMTSVASNISVEDNLPPIVSMQSKIGNVLKCSERVVSPFPSSKEDANPTVRHNGASFDSLEEIGDYIETDFPSKASRTMFGKNTSSSSSSSDDDDNDDEGYGVAKPPESSVYDEWLSQLHANENNISNVLSNSKAMSSPNSSLVSQFSPSEASPSAVPPEAFPLSCLRVDAEHSLSGSSESSGREDNGLPCGHVPRRRRKKRSSHNNRVHKEKDADDSGEVEDEDFTDHGTHSVNSTDYSLVQYLPKDDFSFPVSQGFNYGFSENDHITEFISIQRDLNGKSSSENSDGRMKCFSGRDHVAAVNMASHSSFSHGNLHPLEHNGIHRENQRSPSDTMSDHINSDYGAYHFCPIHTNNLNYEDSTTASKSYNPFVRYTSLDRGVHGFYKHSDAARANFVNSVSNQQKKHFSKESFSTTHWRNTHSPSDSSDEEENISVWPAPPRDGILTPEIANNGMVWVAGRDAECMKMEDLQNLTPSLQNAVIMKSPYKLEESSGESADDCEHIYEEIDGHEPYLFNGENHLHVVPEEYSKSPPEHNCKAIDLKKLKRRCLVHQGKTEKVMIWNEYEASVMQEKQMGASDCGITALFNVLKALNFMVNKDLLCKAVVTNQRMNAAPIPYYLFSRSVAGTTADALIEGLNKVTGGAVKGRFFPFYPPRKVDLLKWLGHWMKKGAVPMATLNLQRGVKPGWTVPDAWHHQMIYGVGSKGVYLTNPQEIVSEETIMEQLTSDSVLLVQRQDVVNRFRDWAPLNDLLKQHDIRWQDMNVLGQVVNVLREACTLPTVQGHRHRTQLTSHVTIPASYKAGITLFVHDDKDKSTLVQDLFLEPDLEVAEVVTVSDNVGIALGEYSRGDNCSPSNVEDVDSVPYFFWGSMYSPEDYENLDGEASVEGIEEDEEAEVEVEDALDDGVGEGDDDDDDDMSFTNNDDKDKLNSELTCEQNVLCAEDSEEDEVKEEEEEALEANVIKEGKNPDDCGMQE